MDEDLYLSLNGASRQDMGEPALHKNRGRHSDKTWRKMVDAQAEKDRLLIDRREILREEYWQKVQDGEMRPRNRLERLQQTADGHPDNPATLAAKRLLTKLNQK